MAFDSPVRGSPFYHCLGSSFPPLCEEGVVEEGGGKGGGEGVKRGGEGVERGVGEWGGEVGGLGVKGGLLW